MPRLTFMPSVNSLSKAIEYEEDYLIHKIEEHFDEVEAKLGYFNRDEEDYDE